MFFFYIPSYGEGDLSAHLQTRPETIQRRLGFDGEAHCKLFADGRRKLLKILDLIISEVANVKLMSVSRIAVFGGGFFFTLPIEIHLSTPG
jgi:hypothetical protein